MRFSLMGSTMACLLFAGNVLGSSGGYGSSLYPAPTSKDSAAFKMGMDAVARKDYQHASEFFQVAIQNNPNDAEAFNMLAYSRRMLGHLDEATQFYARALSLRPRFPAAREYLGEAYIQAALEQIKILREYGPEGEKDLRQLIDALQEAAISSLKVPATTP